MSDTLKSNLDSDYQIHKMCLIRAEIHVKEFIRRVEKRYNRYVACNGVCGVPIKQILKEESGFEE